MKLEIKGLHVSIEGKKILKGINLTINKGEITAIMGPNGSGKSTLSYAIMGHPEYHVDKGKIILEGTDVTKMPTDERARKGLFLSFQYPHDIQGVTMINFLKTAVNANRAKPMPFPEFKKLLDENTSLLKIDQSMLRRYLNDGFSGGEKKKSETLQLAILKPKYAILDETDSGLDIDALKVVSGGINSVAGPKIGILMITHYQRLLNYVKPDKIYILMDGKIVHSGGRELAEHLEKEGYDWLKEK